MVLKRDCSIRIWRRHRDEPGPKSVRKLGNASLPTEAQHSWQGEGRHGKASDTPRMRRLIRCIALVILCGPVLARLNAR